MSYLIPSLDSGSDRTDDDGEVQGFGVLPLVRELKAEMSLLLLGKLLDVLEVRRILRNESAPLQHRCNLVQSTLGREPSDVLQQLLARDVGQRVLDPVGSGRVSHLCAITNRRRSPKEW